MTQKTRKGKHRNFDSQHAASNTYNDYAGAQKNLSVGPVLQPIRTGSGWTCDATTVQELPAGTQVAIYNNSAVVGAVAFSTVLAVTVGAVGSVDVNGSPTIACKPADWTYICCGERTFIQTSAATLLVYVIQDDTVLK